MNKLALLGVCAVFFAVASTANGEDNAVVVTSSNAAANELLVYDANGVLVQAVPTQGQGGVGGNAGGIATRRTTVAVVNFGSQSVSIFDRGEAGFVMRELVSTVSQPVSVAFGPDHLYVLGTTTVESHRIDGSTVDPVPDGVVTLSRADGSAAQVGVAGDQLVISEKSGAIETADLRDGAVVSPVVEVEIPTDSDTPFGLVTRGANAYVTIAHSDEIGLIKNDRLLALAATGSGFPDGPGQQAPCWVALLGPYLFTTNTASHSISRLVATGRQIILDVPVAALTTGAPLDIAADPGRLAVVEADGNDQAHLTQFRVEDDGTLVQVATTAIAAPANGVGFVSLR
jgi:hypothetical protein